MEIVSLQEVLRKSQEGLAGCLATNTLGWVTVGVLHTGTLTLRSENYFGGEGREGMCS